MHGTQNVLEAAIRHGASRFVLISTDKAADPISVLGASKRLAELVVQRAAGGPVTLASVRFGNVLGSRGSFLTVLADQIARAEPVTVTHPDVSRFFMTVEEAVGLVLEAAAMAEYAETFVLDMGEPVQIVDLVRNYAEQLKLPDVEIRYTGLRPGEKLTEKVFSDAEERVPSAHPKIWATRRTEPPPDFPVLLEQPLRRGPRRRIDPGQGAIPAARAGIRPVAPPGDARQRRRALPGRLLMRAVTTAGERVLVDCDIPWLSRLLADAAAGELSEADGSGETVRLQVQADRRPFDRDGWALVGRGAWAASPRALLEDACSSGFDLQVEPRGSVLHVTARYRPAPRTRAANMLLGARFRLLAAQTLLHYPALWWASVRGRVPLHVSVTAGAGGVTMIAGPGGVGKSTMLSAGLNRGEVATADNLCACDARIAYGVVEPLRVDGGRGRAAATHGRSEYAMPGRVPSLEPDRLVVLRRASGPRASAGPLPSAEAARELIAGTYMAGELRRFWAFAGTLALATGIGPAHPDVCGIAASLADRLPCFEVRMAHGSPAPIGELLSLAGAR